MSDREKNWWAGGGTGQQKGNEVPFPKEVFRFPCVLLHLLSPQDLRVGLCVHKFVHTRVQTPDYQSHVALSHKS